MGSFALVLLGSLHFGVFLLLNGDGGPHLEAFGRLSASLSLFLGTAVSLWRDWPGTSRRGWLHGLMQCALAIAILVLSLDTALLAYAAGVGLLLRSRGVVGTALTTAAVFSLGATQIPYLSLPLEAVSGEVSDVFFEGSLSPTILCLPPLMLGAFACLLSSAHGASRGRVVVSVIALSGIWAAHLLRLQQHMGADQPEAMALAEAGLGTCLLVSLVAGWCVAGTSRSPGVRIQRAWRFALAGFGLACLLSYPLVQPVADKQTRIRVLSEGGLDWNRPAFGKYGLFDHGMFGLLPVYLGRDGFSMDVMTPETILPESVADTDILVVINNPRVWTPEERSVIDSFLRRGRSVLVLGDHTDVFGLMKGLNSLLLPYGVSFRFDSAYPVEHPWEKCTRMARHAVVASAPAHFELGHGIGASLATSPHVLELATATYAFSDWGVRENVAGAYLGDYSLQASESLGDLDLIAWRSVGAGKLVVYGDTSAFQNGSLPSTYEAHVLPLFRWLSRPATWTEQEGGRASITITLLLALVLALRNPDSARSVSLGIGLVLGLAVGDIGVMPAAARIDDAVVLVDQGSHPWVGHYQARMNPIGPLHSSAARCGLLSIESTAFEGRGLDARVVAFVAPTRHLDDEELGALSAFAEQGGIVIVVAGREPPVVSDRLLARFDLEVAHVPLGRIPRDPLSREQDSGDPQFLSAWPLRDTRDVSAAVTAPEYFAANGDEVLASDGRHVVALFRRRGSGGIVAIGDSRFFSTMNVEGEWGHSPGNVQFLYGIFADICGGDWRGVEDLFPSPDKPR